jgi:hypothetical protein
MEPTFVATWSAEEALAQLSIYWWKRGTSELLAHQLPAPTKHEGKCPEVPFYCRLSHLKFIIK